MGAEEPGAKSCTDPSLAEVPTTALEQGEQGQVAEGAGCMMVRLERVEDGRRSVAIDTHPEMNKKIVSFKGGGC